jgi:hypothetical protein
MGSPKGGQAPDVRPQHGEGAHDPPPGCPVSPPPQSFHLRAQRAHLSRRNLTAAGLSSRVDRRGKSRAPANYQCQKCLNYGHYTYECSGSAVYMKRPSRSEVIRDPSLHPSYTLDVPPPELPEYVFPPSSRPCVVCVCVRAIQPSLRGVSVYVRW